MKRGGQGEGGDKSEGEDKSKGEDKSEGFSTEAALGVTLDRFCRSGFGK